MSARRIVVVLPAAAHGETSRPLLDAAARLAAAGGRRLDIIELRGEAPAGAMDVPPALAAATTWWRFHHPAFAGDDPEVRLVALPALLEQTGGSRDEAMLLLLPWGPWEGLAARLAARLRATTLGRVQALALDGPAVRVRRAAWGGRVAVELACETAVCVACWRPAAQSGDAETLPPDLHQQPFDGPLPPAQETQRLPPADAFPPLEGARLVVSGGRGMGGEAGFALLARLARGLGAALGASLPAVDAGWAPVSRQVGQSGKFVAPALYLAVGISGTPQHLAGVSEETRVIAVNDDPHAPIFERAGVGAVADWKALLPLLCEAIETSLPVSTRRS